MTNGENILTPADTPNLQADTCLVEIDVGDALITPVAEIEVPVHAIAVAPEGALISATEGGGGGGCSLAANGSKSTSFLPYLLIPLLVAVKRIWRSYS